MDWLTFIAEMTKALAWPAGVVVIFLLLRKPLTELIPLIQRLRYAGLELDFGRRVRELAATVEKEIPTLEKGLGGPSHLHEHWEQLAQFSARAVILEAWLELEAAAIEASRRYGLELSSQERRTPLLLGHALEQAGVLDETKMEIFHKLRNLRNAAAHASEFAFEADSALEYADAAMRLAAYLREA